MKLKVRIVPAQELQAAFDVSDTISDDHSKHPHPPLGFKVGGINALTAENHSPQWVR
jgi:hypothetical protein